MCTNSGLPSNDSLYGTGIFYDSTLLPVTTGLPIVVTGNDGTMNGPVAGTCAFSMAVMQLAEFSYSTPNAGRIYPINCFSGGVGANSPAGWFGKQTSADNSGASGAVWHAGEPFVRHISGADVLYLPAFRTPNNGQPAAHDVTILRSDNGGISWKNPNTYANAGAADATGDFPKCDALNGTTACLNALYLAGTPNPIMWKALTGNVSGWKPILYVPVSGVMPTTGDGCDPNTYTCFFGGEAEGTLMRLPNVSIQDVTTAQYYTCPTLSDSFRCDSRVAGSWSSTLGDRTPVYPNVGSVYSFVTAAYLPEFKAYVSGAYNCLRGQSCPQNVNGFRWAPKPEGPWTYIAVTGTVSWQVPSFLPIPVLGYNVISTTPPRVNVPMIANTPPGLHTAGGSPYFLMWDLVSGRNGLVPGGSDTPVYNPMDILRTNSGLVISDSHAPGTIPRNGIVAAWDFFDQTGDTSQTGNSANLFNAGFHDIASGGMFLTPCAIGFLCGAWGSNKTLTAYGAQFASTGANPGMLTMTHWGPTTISNGLAATTTGGMTPANMTALAGNSSYTVVQVARIDTLPGPGQVEPFWSVGDWSGTNTWVELHPDSAKTVLLWGTNTGLWWFNSSYTFTATNWYFIATVVQANGATPAANLWVGIGGKLVDEFVGVSRTAAGTAATQTPNVTAKPFTLRNAGPMVTDALDSSYAGTYVYNRALNRAEAGLMYTTLKANAAKRGLTVQ
jgi:hypothetical protein